uniref:Aminoglycoside phosphotransferase domain-containing protein n=1 Tax=viral metagenome TaxID=1070528 RepID=A0A6C0B2P2_9ZZZZ
MSQHYEVLNRIGYGSVFNEISIDYSNNLIKKVCVNEYGKNKIEHEKRFYKYIIDNKIVFKTPKIYSFLENGYIMQYLNNYEPLYKNFCLMDRTIQKELIMNIEHSLSELHATEKKYVSKAEYILNLNTEIYEKIKSRHDLIKTNVAKYDFITKVNGITILSFDEILNSLNELIYKCIDEKPENDFFLSPIHGDCQFNNILYNFDTKDYVFIDPRGYYGKNNIYGIPEYDYSKVLFALSGYDEFDNRDIIDLEIKDDDIKIDIRTLDKDVFIRTDLAALLMYTIWLGNAECFMKKNEKKGIYSYFLSLYLGTKILNNLY